MARLIGLLDHESTEIAEDAKGELMSIGGEVVLPLTVAVRSLDYFGQLSAIEVFEHFGDLAAGPSLIGLLDSEAATVREWAAGAVAQLGVPEAVPALRAAYRRQRAGGDELDFTEAVALRRALTVLGARQDVLPPLAASLLVPAGSWDFAWSAAHLTEVVNDLADHDQAVLYFQLWTAADGSFYWQNHERLDQTLDVGLPWPHVVEAAREAALIEAAFVVPRGDLLATIEWVDHADL
ncbi:HEAT repeat domain-containing protein [Actinoplanes bogorensis]|uniref:HEAT repeat domain-containing protein n=1 Tax=Paractinoplanes bogorensis TaxID=1610840 RepID=A0ABS5Z1D7_9ACTN|nr:HEAT repeat domain-containing protein [Actinoplanes bogorensis]